MTIKTVRLDRNTLVAGLAKLFFFVHRNILAFIIFGRMAGDATTKAYNIIAVRPDSLAHGQITLVNQEFHMVTTHIIRIDNNTALQIGRARSGQHFCRSRIRHVDAHQAKTQQHGAQQNTLQNTF